MNRLHLNPPAVVALADELERKPIVLESLGSRMVQSAGSVNSGAADLDAQTRAAIGKVQAAFAGCGKAFEAITDALDDTVRKYLAANEAAAADQQELRARLDALRLDSGGSTPVSGAPVRPGPG